MARMTATEQETGALVIEWTNLVPNDPLIDKARLVRAAGLLGYVEASGGFGGTVGLRKGTGLVTAGQPVKDTAGADVALATDVGAEFGTAALYVWPTPPATGIATVRIVFQRGD